MATSIVVIAYEISNNGARIIGEYSFTPSGTSHEFTYPARQAAAAAEAQLESECGLRTERVILFGDDPARHAEKLAAARADILTHFAGANR